MIFGIMENMNMGSKKAYGYIRVSTEEQVNGVSLDNQKEKIQQYADANDIEVIGWFEDPGISAKTANRPGLKKMLDAVKKHRGEVDHVVVYNVSRISRNIESYMRDIGCQLARNGVTLRSTMEQIDETSQGKLFLNFSLMMHQFDNDVKGEQTHDNMTKHFTDGGWWMGGRTPLGFKVKRVPVEGKQRDGHQKSHAILVPDNTNGVADKIAFLLNRFSEGDLNKRVIRNRPRDGSKGIQR